MHSGVGRELFLEGMQPVATIKLTHKNPLVAEATQFRDAGDLPFLYRPTITLLTVF